MTSTDIADGSPFVAEFLQEVADVAKRLDRASIEQLARLLTTVRDVGGRVFVIGVGGSAANASHAAADLRALASIEAYSPTDNVAGFSASANDLGWRNSISVWLSQSRMSDRDCLLVFSVGGGSIDPELSVNLVAAMEFAEERGTPIAGIVGPRGGETSRRGQAVIEVPVADPRFVTTHAEIFQAVIWHLLVMHPLLATSVPTWERFT